ncbi:unnamed protein product [Effrenium voratum]|uniref:Uncharacterized protein n=1 Tax=Effrenium voratum TaxID=2562239 RepID=A0AA36MSI5_9DINO|nr:unnamed protein product [Effrenium voratum]CAJ1412905.1 unnamed protein product [Effrenium voratum]
MEPAVAPDASEPSQEPRESTPEEPAGFPRKIFRFVGNVGHRIFDNMSFVGEVLVEFMEWDKHPYHREMEQLRKEQRHKQIQQQIQEEQKEEKEAAEVASLEAPTGQ